MMTIADERDEEIVHSDEKEKRQLIGEILLTYGSDGKVPGTTSSGGRIQCQRHMEWVVDDAGTGETP